MAKKFNFEGLLEKAENQKTKNIIIDADFQELIPPLQKEEFEQLEKNIIEQGVRESLIVWEEEYILVDGHNRYQIAQKNNIQFKVSLKSFASREEVSNWIIENQLGRRNLTPIQMSYFRGLRYNVEKKQYGGKRNSSPQIGDLKQTEQEGGVDVPKKEKTSERLAKELGVSKNTIERDGKFAETLNELGKKDSILKKEILSGKVKKSKEEIESLLNEKNKELPKPRKKDDETNDIRYFKLAEIDSYTKEQLYELCAKFLKEISKISQKL